MIRVPFIHTYRVLEPCVPSSKKIIYVDMDHVLCDYASGSERHKAKYPELQYPQSQPGLYESLLPIPGAIDTYLWLHSSPQTEVYVLTAPSIRNPHCYMEKRNWVEKYLGIDIVRNLIISPHKNLNKGDFLIDDQPRGKGQDLFDGKLILFGSDEFPDWSSVRAFFAEVLDQ